MSQAPFPQPSARVPGRGFRIAGAVLLVMGALIAVVAIVGGVILGAVSRSAGADRFAGTQRAFTTSITIDVKQGELFSIFEEKKPVVPASPSPAAGSTPTRKAAWSARMCRVFDASGTELKPGGIGVPHAGRTIDGVAMMTTGHFSPSSDGKATVRCGEAKQRAIASPASVTGAIGDFAGTFIAWGGGVFGVLLAGLGVLFVMLGRSAMRRASRPSPVHRR